MREPPTPCLIGATATGKSEVGVHAARARRGEVICADAFTAYRGMPILTAAPAPPEDVPHHLLGILDPSEHWSAADFAEACDRLIAAIRGRGREPWIVGGSVLYLRGWLKGFGAAVPRDPAYREHLQSVSQALGSGALHRLLAEKDPKRAAELHPNDERRLVRALEIVRATGRPASSQRQEWRGPDRAPAVLIGLRRDPEDLDRRIGRRVEEMFRDGVVEEVRRLFEKPISREAKQVLGLWEVEALLQGRRTLEDTKQLIAQRTRRFARRQMTFFRSFRDLHWIDVEPDEPADAIAKRVLDHL